MAAEGGWVTGARRVLSPNCDSRPAGAAISLVVLHSISLPPGVYGGDAIERLFTNQLDPAAHPSFADLAGVRVSAHFLVRRDGELLQFVPLQARAWHAGASRWRGRERCNDFSVGVELEGTRRQRASPPAQYCLPCAAGTRTAIEPAAARVRRAQRRRARPQDRPRRALRLAAAAVGAWPARPRSSPGSALQ